MKNLTKKSLLFLVLFASMMTYANNEINTVKERESKVTIVSFKKLKLGSKLSIKDVNGIVLYKESIIKAGDYSKGFDLTSLPNGDYVFELDTELKITIIPFNVVSNQVAFKKDKKSTVYKPFVRVKDDRVYVSRLSLEEDPIECKIYYENNYELVLAEKFEKESQLKRIYDFSTAEKGNYVFVFKSNGRTFTKTVKI
ncbi:hypothetical protein QWY87_07815 [Lutimonas halocynthiae]|uniref:hypothetical protein n=1 Tax=Lutimonas halocynthiae TaxID=1446477 RepID=UPI0025B4FA9E|nr:hypothetical protein [Lutimonas halocynthiae]MDN3642598.1 hypothetical protein [Lutimonas halocynthiae]